MAVNPMPWPRRKHLDRDIHEFVSKQQQSLGERSQRPARNSLSLPPHPGPLLRHHVVLSPQQKLEIALQLDELGISQIEAGFPKVSPEDAEAITIMRKANLKAELWGFSRAVRGILKSWFASA